MKTSIIIQARMGSKRLPGKNLIKITREYSLIELVILRLQKSKKIDDIIVATSNKQVDDKLVKKIKKLNVKIHRGPEKDTLKRFFQAAKKFKVKKIIRITSDCALSDPRLVDNYISIFDKKKLDYLSNTLHLTGLNLKMKASENFYNFPDGFDIEIFNFKLLSKAYKKVKKKNRKEGAVVTQFFKLYPAELKKNKIYAPLSEYFHKDRYKLSVDTKKDLFTVRKIFKFFGKNIHFSYSNVMTYLNNFSKQKKINKNFSTLNKAKKFILGENMLVSKNHNMILPDIWPSYFSKTKDCFIWDLERKKYTDISLMGVGTNILGYSNKEVDKAINKVVLNGNLSTLNCSEEVKLAEKLLHLHPWFDKVKFARSGGEANSIAIRIARSNANKTNVAICGYHGWHDWYLSANLSSKKNLNQHLLSGLSPIGIPKQLKNTTFTFNYGDYSRLEDLITNREVGIVKMEVCRSTSPNINFLKKVRKLCNQKNIILIFDECTSGFRECLGGLHKKIKIYPDIAILGKALGNGYAITAVIGKKSVMENAKNSFMSSTFWTERIGPTAALKTLEIMEKTKSWEAITKIGKNVQKIWLKTANRNGIKIDVTGLPSLSKFFFKHHHSELKTLLTQEFLKKNYLATNAIYTCVSHNEKILKRYEELLDEVFFQISDIIKNKEDIKKYIKSRLAQTPFTRLN